MSNEAVQVTENTEIEVSDEQVEQFFESGGKEAPETPETEAVETPEPETKAEEVKEEPKVEDKPDDRKVPYGALHEERMRRKELAEKVQKMEDRFAQLMEKFQKPEPQAPSFDDDPFENLKFQQEQLNQKLQTHEQTINEQRQTFEQQRQQQELVSRYQMDAVDFAKEHGDFQEAYGFLMKQRQQELQAFGYDPQQAAQIIAQEEIGAAYKAFEDGVSPAERIYRIAQVRGYKKSEPATNEPSAEAKKLETVAKGVENSKSLSGGGKVEKDLSLEALAEMEDDEFDQAWAKLIGTE